MLLGKTSDNGVGDQMLLTNNPKAGEEEAGAFLTFCSSGGDALRRPSINSLEQGVCRRRSWNYVTACLLVSVALVGVTVLVVGLYRSHEVVALRTELDALRRDVDKLKHRILEEDLLEQLKAFEDAVYAEEATSEDDDHNDDDCDGDDYGVDYSEERTPSRLVHGKKPHVDKTTEEKLKHGHDKTGNQPDVSPGRSARSKREIQPSVLPVISESYGVDYKHNNSNSEGLRLYESLVSSGGKNEPKDTSLDWGSTENPIKNYHRVSPLWTSKSQQKKYVGSSPQYTDAPVYRRHRDRSRQTTTSAPPPIISRVSRVMHTDSSDPLLHQPPPPPAPAPLTLEPQHHKLPDGETVVRVYQEQRASQGATVAGPGDIITVERQVKPHIRRKKQGQQHRNSGQFKELDDHSARSGRPVIAAHYDGDTSNYTLGHTHYQGNGRLRHPDGKFTDWKMSSWMQQLGMNKFFQFHDGTVTVKEGGIYFIYAQIYYVDEHDMNGFRMYLNNTPVLHCTTMTVHSSGEQKRPKSNTCHTSAAVYIAPDDKISVRDVDGLRYSLFEPAKSFFGLIRLGNNMIK